MIFASKQYLAFFVAVFLAYWHVDRKKQNILLLLASYFFYGCWDWRFLSLIGVCTIANFFCGRRLHATDSLRLKRIWLTVSIAISLLILGYFKYANFFISNLVFLLNFLGIYVSKTTLDITLPVGISFYTFQSMSYPLDLYTGRLKRTTTLINFATFVAFFPQLVAGPIVRASEFLEQLDVDRVFTGPDLEAGARRFLIGFFKKAFVADVLAIHLIDPVFANPSAYTSLNAWLAMIGYTVQVYMDFSGYSDMAIGSAQMLGFKLPENFNFPYLATSIVGYWRRWHMTMSTFFRDYVYFPLGGSRKGFRRTILNLWLVTFISGLWHGASWNFVCWGSLHGLLIILTHIYRRAFNVNDKVKNTSFHSLYVVITGALALTANIHFRIFFRSRDIETSFVYFRTLYGSHAHTIDLHINPLVWFCFFCLIAEHTYGWFKENRNVDIWSTNLNARGLMYLGMIVFLFHAVPKEANPFIYFDF